MGWYGALKDMLKQTSDSVGLDNFITHIPGSGKDAANAAKLAAIATGAYFAAPYVAGTAVGSGGAGASTGGATSASAVPVEEAGFQAGTLPSGEGWTAGSNGGAFGKGDMGAFLKSRNFGQMYKNMNAMQGGQQNQQSQQQPMPVAQQQSYQSPQIRDYISEMKSRRGAFGRPATTQFGIWG